MWYAATAARLLLGITFIFSAGQYFATAFGGNYGENLSGDSREFIMSMHRNGYFIAVKVVELVGGLLLVSGYLVPVGLSLLGPVIVNIALYSAFINREPTKIGVAAVLVVMLVFLVAAYRRQFAAVFDPHAKPG